MDLASTTAVVFWILVLAVAGWALAAGALRRPRRGRRMGEDLYCAYCSWPADRSAAYGPVRWQGRVYCGLLCLRADSGLRVREGCRD